jgi:hypothetical protein
VSGALYAAEEPTGVDYYFGIGVKQDFVKALRLFQQEKDYVFLVLMHLNGEGTPVDLAKAQQLLAEDLAQQGRRYATMGVLEEIVTERLKAPAKTYPRVLFCEVATTTPDINQCASIQLALSNQAAEALVRKVTDGMGPAQRSNLQAVVQHFDTMNEHEGSRVYMEYISGTVRGFASMGHQS